VPNASGGNQTALSAAISVPSTTNQTAPVTPPTSQTSTTANITVPSTMIEDVENNSPIPDSANRFDEDYIPAGTAVIAGNCNV
jgi:hypothetical protein